MRASVYHLQINARDGAVSIPFYRALLGYLEYRVTYEAPGVLGMSNRTTDLWIMAVPPDRRPHAPHRKNPGLNHIAFRVDSRADVDHFHTDFLRPHKIPVLYGGPRDYPEYRAGYYAVFFEDPDRLKLEVVHIP
jgi:catechol 2,3-dioxygenase-like lactoylglutathione lyase family enzyme